MLNKERYKMHHKDMEVWKQAMELVFKIYKLTEDFPKDEMFGLTSQIRRCAVSVPSNIAEGCGRFSDKETLRFISIASGSLAEMETQILIAHELNFINETEDIIEQINKLSALLIGLKNYLKNKEKTT
jgi:four helix bundle protein